MFGILDQFFSEKQESLQTDEMDINKKVEIATCALLLEVANADKQFSAMEKDRIIEILKHDYKIHEECIFELIETAEKERSKSIDLWHFTHRINENYSLEEKIKVVETVWKIIYADGKLDKHEDYLIHKLSKLLNLDHKHMIGAKLKVLHSKG